MYPWPHVSFRYIITKDTNVYFKAIDEDDGTICFSRLYSLHEPQECTDPKGKLVTNLFQARIVTKYSNPRIFRIRVL